MLLWTSELIMTHRRQKLNFVQNKQISANEMDMILNIRHSNRHDNRLVDVPVLWRGKSSLVPKSVKLHMPPSTCHQCNLALLRQFVTPS